MREEIRITLFLPGVSRSVIVGQDERLCCIGAENALRAWMAQGIRPALEIAGHGAEQVERIRTYLHDVMAEILGDLRTRNGARFG